MFLTKEEVINRFISVHKHVYDYSLFEYNGMHNKSCIICSKHGKFWQEPHTHLRGGGCPKCGLESRSKKRKLNTDEFIRRAKNKHGENYDYSKVEYIDSKTKVCIICPKHGEFWQKPTEHILGRGCSECYNDRRKVIHLKDFNVFLKELTVLYGVKYNFSNYNYVNYNTRSEVLCEKHGIFKRSPYELLHGKHCPICMRKERAIKRRECEESKWLQKAKEIHNNKYDYSKVVYKNCYTLLEIICPKHGSFWQRAYYHLQGNGCQQCAKELINSASEIELGSFIKENNIEIKSSMRDIIPPLELDIVIENNKIAIEFDGLYWHSELKKDKNYHLDKTNKCEEQGYRLIHIFEDEWLFKKDIVKSRLKNILGVTTNKIYARKCEIRVVDYNTSKVFLETNHIQGNCVSKIRYGLYYNDELVSLMSFGNKRKNLGSTKTENCYELLRFCNKLDTTVVGGASKLFKHFIKEYKPNEIISYSDRRWSNGNLYNKLGFIHSHNSQPSYFYVQGEKRYNRFMFRKDILVKQGFDKNKSEHQIMLDRGIYRIYDCGTMVFKWKKI